MSRHLVILAATFLLAQAEASTLDSLYEGVFVALKRQCSESYPDLKEGIDRAIRDYISTNQEFLSSDYDRILEAKAPSARSYTREQCVGMAAAIPKEPMKDLLRRAAKEREEEMRRRGVYERSQR